MRELGEIGSAVIVQHHQLYVEYETLCRQLIRALATGAHAMSTIAKVFGGRGMLVCEMPDGSAYWFCHLKGITVNPVSGGSVTATLFFCPWSKGGGVRSVLHGCEIATAPEQ